VKKILIVAALAAFVFAAGQAMAQTPAYVGAQKCQICHKTEKQGQQYPLWEQSKHSQSFAALSKPEAAEKAKTAGVTGNPAESPVCLKCHAVAGTGGNAAPALDGVASRGDARYLLHSLVNPSESIAKGYENAGASAMPAMGPILSDAEIRDAVAYLKTLK